MKEPKWQQNVLLVSDDPEIKGAVAPAFGAETNLTSVQNTKEAIELIDKTVFQVLIIDTTTTNPILTYSEETKEVPFIELSQYANQLNLGLTIILLVNKLIAKDGDFARKSGATLIMDRKSISINRMIYMIRVMRKRTFRTILSRDIPLDAVFSVDLYHHLSLNERYSVFLQAGSAFSSDKISKIHSTNTRHLYLKDSDLGAFLSVIRSPSESVHYSEELSSIRNQFRQLLIQLFDISTDGMIHFGNDIHEKGMELIKRLETLISLFPSDAACLKELPYPRWSTLAHSLNCAIYSIIFSKHCKLSSVNEIAFAAMFQNIGLAEIDQGIIQKKETELTQEEHEQYKKHVTITMDLLRKKLVPFTPLVEKIILSHHENFDGTGFPSGLAGVNLPLECALVSILSSFDYFNTVRPGKKPVPPQVAWLQLKEYHGKSTQLNKKFHPTLLIQLDEFFSSNFS